jgi:hypothetical protein
MTKFLTYAFLFMVVVGGCSEAFSSTDYTTHTTLPITVAAVDSTIASTIPETVPPATPSRSGSTSGKGSSLSSGDSIDCDNAEELYDSGEMTDDIADYCDYGPDGEWDTSDNYDGWES